MQFDPTGMVCEGLVMSYPRILVVELAPRLNGQWASCRLFLTEARWSIKTPDGEIVDTDASSLDLARRVLPGREVLRSTYDRSKSVYALAFPGADLSVIPDNPRHGAPYSFVVDGR